MVPSKEVIDDIKALPQFNGDISFITKSGMSAQEIADYVATQSGPVIYNISQATQGEIALLRKAQAILEGRQESQGKIVLIDEAARINSITMRITRDVVSNARDAFKKFVLEALKNPENFIGEWNNFVVVPGREDEMDIDTLHYWKNIGLLDIQDSVRNDVKAMIDEVCGEVTEEMEQNVLPELNPSEHIVEIRDKVNTILLGMLSNMVRGVFYHYSNATKVYGMRELAVGVLSGCGQLRGGTERC